MLKEKQKDKSYDYTNINADSDNSKQSNISPEEPNTLIKQQFDPITQNLQNSIHGSFVDLVDNDENSNNKSNHKSEIEITTIQQKSDDEINDEVLDKQKYKKPVFFNFESQLFKQNKDYEGNTNYNITPSKIKNLNDISSSQETLIKSNSIRKFPTNLIIPNSLPLVESEIPVITSNSSENYFNHDIQNISLSINDIVEIYCETDSKIHKGKILKIESSLTLKNNNIKSDLPDELYYYIHFLDYEKRMDNWMPASSIIKKIIMSQPISKINSRKINKSSQGVEPFTLESHMFSFSQENSMLTRKKSNVNDHGLLNDHIEFESKIKNIERIIIGNYNIEAWYYSPFPPQMTINKILFICEYCLKYMLTKQTLIVHIVNYLIN